MYFLHDVVPGIHGFDDLRRGQTVEYTVPDIFGRPWARIWEQYHEQGIRDPGAFAFGANNQRVDIEFGERIRMGEREVGDLLDCVDRGGGGGVAIPMFLFGFFFGAIYVGSLYPDPPSVIENLPIPTIAMAPRRKSPASKALRGIATEGTSLSAAGPRTAARTSTSRNSAAPVKVLCSR